MTKNNQKPITLAEIRQLIEKQLAELVDASERCHLINETAEINQAICLSVQTLIAIKNQCDAEVPADSPFQPPSSKN